MGRRKKTLFILLGITMLAVIGYYYVVNFFLPVKLKEIISQQAQSFLKRRVVVGDIDFRFIHGFTIKDLKIFQKDLKDQSFVEFEEANFNIILTSVFKNSTIIIPSIRIKKPYIHIIKENADTFNFSDLIPANENKNTGTSKTPPVYIARVMIENGVIEYTDRSLPQEFKERIEQINLTARGALNKNVYADVNAFMPSQNSAGILQGQYDIPSKKFTVNFSTPNLNLTPYAVFLPASLPLKISSLTFNNLKAQISGGENNFLLKTNLELTSPSLEFDQQSFKAVAVKSPEFSISQENGEWRLTGSLAIPGLELMLKDQKSVKGDFSADLTSLSVIPTDKKLNLQGKLKADNAQLNLSALQHFAANLEINNLDLSSDQTNVNFKGDLTLNQSDFVLGTGRSLKSDIALTNLQINSSEKNINAMAKLSLKNILLTLSENQTVRGDITSPQIKTTLTNNNLSLQGVLSTSQITAKIDNEKEFSGNPNINLNLNYNLTDPSSLNYSAAVALNESRVKGLPVVDEINPLAGNLVLKPNSAELKQINITTQGMHAVVSGNVTDLASPSANLEISSDDVDLAKALAFLPDDLKKIGLQADGSAKIRMSIRGLLNALQATDISAKIDLSKTNLSAPQLPAPIQNIDGHIEYGKDLISWKELKGTFQDRNYLLNGQLANFSLPIITTDLKSENVTVSAQIKLLNKAFQILALNAKYLNSTADIKGDVHLKDNAEPLLDLRTNFLLDLKDLDKISADFFPAQKEQIAKLQLNGIIKSDGLFRGQPKDWRNWELNMNAQSPKISALGFEATDFTTAIDQRDRHINKLNILAKVYEGDFGMLSTADLTKESAPFNANLQISALSLAKLAESDRIKNKKIGGKFNLYLEALGPLQKPNEITGTGKLSMTEGTIFEWNILEGLFGALLINDFKRNEFTEAKADLAIRDRKLYLGNGTMTSKLVTLAAKGWVDFDQNIDLEVSPQFSEGAIQISDQLAKKFPTTILTQTEGYIQVKITGTLSKPKYVTETHPFKILKETGEFIKEGLGGLLDGIF